VKPSRILLTGMNGTVAPVLAAELRSRGHEAIAWDRTAVPPADEKAVADCIRRSGAEALVHCGMGDPRWAEHMADCCDHLGVAFLYTGSVSVYGPHQVGPFGVERSPEPTDDYGRYKLQCERRVLAAHARAQVVRLGWQIALRPGGNQMVEHFMRRQAETGQALASTRWFQACSFLDDTARVLAHVLEELPPGLYHLDGNPGWSMHRVVSALNRAMGGTWNVHPCEDPGLNNLVRDARLPSVSIEPRLAAWSCGGA
jgi:dTDP-4-dehydrorhamnose reductase